MRPLDVADGFLEFGIQVEFKSRNELHIDTLWNT